MFLGENEQQKAKPCSSFFCTCSLANGSGAGVEGGCMEGGRAEMDLQKGKLLKSQSFGYSWKQQVDAYSSCRGKF